MCQLVIVCQLFIMLINNHEAALISSQAHAKPNKEEMLGAFVIILIDRFFVLRIRLFDLILYLFNL